MTTNKQKQSILWTMQAAVEESMTLSGAPLEGVETLLDEMRTRCNISPDMVLESELMDVAEMLQGFMIQSITNIRRFLKKLDRDTEFKSGFLMPNDGLLLLSEGMFIIPENESELTGFLYSMTGLTLTNEGFLL